MILLDTDHLSVLKYEEPSKRQETHADRSEFSCHRQFSWTLLLSGRPTSVSTFRTLLSRRPPFPLR